MLRAFDDCRNASLLCNSSSLTEYLIALIESEPGHVTGGTLALMAGPCPIKHVNQEWWTDSFAAQVGDALTKGISGGQKKRLCVSMALIKKPAVTHTSCHL